MTNQQLWLVLVVAVGALAAMTVFMARRRQRGRAVAVAPPAAPPIQPPPPRRRPSLSPKELDEAARYGLNPGFSADVLSDNPAVEPADIELISRRVAPELQEQARASPAYFAEHVRRLDAAPADEMVAIIDDWNAGSQAFWRRLAGGRPVEMLVVDKHEASSVGVGWINGCRRL